jgi:hypothetical protein
MTTEFQPVDRRITVYIPENWIQPDAGSGSGSYINFPTAQTANISFPATILCSNFQSFAPTAAMNLLNNSTTGNIQFANNSGYSGGIVINADGTAPEANKIIIGDSARALVAPLLHTSEIYGTGAFSAQIDVKADFIVNTGYGLYTNFVEQNSGGILTLGGVNGSRIDIGTGAGRTDAINIGTNMTVAGDINLGGALGTTNAQKLESGFISCEGNSPLSIGTFAGRTRPIDIGTGMTGGFINLGGATTTVKTDNIGGNTTNLNITTNTSITPLSGLYTNTIEPNGSGLTIGATSGVINLGTGPTRLDVINIGTDMGVASSGAIINVGSTVSGININARLQRGLSLNYDYDTYSGIDTFMGGYKQGTYNNTPVPASNLSINTTEERVVGSISTLLSTGVYILNVNTTLSTSVVNPYLTYAMYSKTTAWTNGNLRGGLGTVNASLSRVNRSLTSATSELVSLSITGLLIVSTKGYYAIVIGEANPLLSQNITYVDTYMSVTRVG